MRDLTLVEFLSVDGVMQGLGSPDEDTDGGFVHGGWGAPFAATIHEATAGGGLDATAAYLFGRRTYEKMASFWPNQPDTDPIAASMNATDKYVATRTLTSFDWAGTHRLDGELTSAVSGLKSGGSGNIVVLGSGVLARELLRQGLVDVLQLYIHPVLLGTGKRLFADLPIPVRLELTNVESTSAGSVALTYRL